MSILPIFIPHAGCPHQCVFCNQKKISGQHSAALASAKEQLARWRSWLRPSLAHEAAFYGGSFTGLPTELQEELLALTDALLAEGFIGSVRLSTRPDYIDEERLQLLQQHGVRLVELGVQSLDDRVWRRRSAATRRRRWAGGGAFKTLRLSSWPAADGGHARAELCQRAGNGA